MPTRHRTGETALSPSAIDGGAGLTPPIKVGMISGLGYRNLRGDLDRQSRFFDGRNVPRKVVRDPADVAAALQEYEREGIELVAVSGGDGTISMVTTYLMNRSRRRPILALLEGGRTNMTAHDVGLRGDQIKRLRDLYDWAEGRSSKKAEVVERPVIGVGPEGAPPECGFFVGAGAIYQGSLATWKFRDDSKLPGMRSGFGTGLSVVRLVARHLMSRSAFAPSRLVFTADGRPIDENQWCVMFACTLQSMVFKMSPFWGEGEGSIRMTAIAQDHRHLLRAAVSAMRGRQGRNNTEALGYHSLNAEGIDIDLDDGVTLDGQIVRHSGPGLKVRTVGSLQFLKL